MDEQSSVLCVITNFVSVLHENEISVRRHIDNNEIKPNTHLFNGPLSGTTPVSRYQKVKVIWTLLKQETVSGSGISWAICKSAPCSRQITMPVPQHPVFYRSDAFPAAQPTVSKHWRQNQTEITLLTYGKLRAEQLVCNQLLALAL